MATVAKHVRKIRKKTRIKKSELIPIPKEMLDKAIAEKSLEEIEDYLEDWELAHDPVLLKRLEKADRDIATGNTIPWEQVKAKLNIKSK